VRHAVPNPATPRQLRPVELITDRAKRYRASEYPPDGRRRCAFCADSGPRLDIDHIDGHESNGSRRNLMYLCRSCNTLKGITQKRAGEGTRTRQYNPQPAAATAPGFRQYVDAVHVLRGDRPGNVRKAARVMQATPPAKREEFVDRIGAARNPEPTAPTYQQYAYAVSIHDKRTHAHDEGGAIIHATPTALRRVYAARIADAKRGKK
jgi:hypothetical protein